MRAAAWVIALAFASSAAFAGAHPPPKPEDTGSASEMLKKKRKKPFESIPGTRVEDKQAYQRLGFLDLAWFEVISEAPELVVQVGLYEAIEPDPGGMILFMLPEGAMSFKFAAYQPEEGEWGLFKVGRSGVFDDPMGRASMEQKGQVITITVPREDIPLDDFLVHAHVLSGADNDSLWKDDCPNGRKGLGIPARPEPVEDASP